jgi:hypothetical protein
MDKAKRAHYKTLANDAIIATFGYDNDTSRLAQALEKCVDELENIGDKCQTCSYCEDHGDHWDEADDDGDYPYEDDEE